VARYQQLRAKLPKTLKYDLGSTTCNSALRCLKLIIFGSSQRVKERASGHLNHAWW
jgi:hypothetical protein